MNFTVLTLFPEMFENFKNTSIIGRAVAENLLEINLVNFRDFASNKHKSVDDAPYGGGAGMVISPQPLFSAIESLDITKEDRVLYLSPKGRVFDQEYAIELASSERIVFVCGHYEGVDQRIIDKYVTDEVSIGDYVLTGGELPTMVIIDAVARMKDGVLGKSVSFEDESHYNGLLEYPHYTRPSVYEELEVPAILLSGNHQKIAQWRLEESIKITASRRMDMLVKLYKETDDKKLKELIKKYL